MVVQQVKEGKDDFGYNARDDKFENLFQAGVIDPTKVTRSALQFAGTLLFNLNTFDAMHPSLTWLQQDLRIWAPDIIGSTLFLASGYLAFIETGHAYWAWNLSSISRWVTFANLMGCLGFMVSAVFAFVPPGGPSAGAVTIATALTLQGAICFFVGSALMLPESKSAGA